MAQHYTRLTQSVMKMCHRCKRETLHNVTDRRVGNSCQRCIDPAGYDAKAAAVKPMTVEVDYPCWCRRYKFPHYHQSDAEKRASQTQFGVQPWRRVRL